ADTVPSDPDALRPVVDLEFGGNCSHRPNPTDLKTDLEAYLEATERHAGKRPILYVTYAFLRAYPVPPNADLWIRDVFSRPRISQGRWLVWQFHSRGRVDGISGPVDLNVFDGPRDAFPANLR
ncbi:MAG: GH25 family lysozyme, partial [Myxococcota bacterium]